MSTLDDLPPDQRAVLQLVLQRGRTYEEIASLLAIDPAAVRQRALDALAKLAPAHVQTAGEHGLITDYLLGQLPALVAEEVVAYLGGSPGDREWALAVRRVLAQLTSGTLPEIPVGASRGAETDSADQPAPTLVPPEPRRGPAPPPVGLPEARPAPAPVPPAPSAGPDRVESVAPEGAARRSARPPARGSRRGGLILLSGLAVAIVVVVVLLLVNSGGSPSPAGSNTVASTTSTASTSTTTAPTTSTASTTKAAKPKLLAALNLNPPAGGSKAAAIVQVIRETTSTGTVTGIVIDAQNMPANTAHNAYAVWLYNSATSSKLLGFVKQLVGKSGKLQTDGELPKDAGKYKQLLITLETQSKPKTPGQVILSGPFREHS